MHQSLTIHFSGSRYTIRAKRGGSQSSYDSGGRKAQSAGAALRRYGEQALREDTRALLKEWQGALKVRPGFPVVVCGLYRPYFSALSA